MRDLLASGERPRRQPPRPRRDRQEPARDRGGRSRPSDLFPDGTSFVALENVLEPALLLPTIAYALGIRDNGEAALEERISHALAGRRVLIVLDNFEQIVDAAPVLVRLYTLAPTATFLVTSRIVLRIRGERVYEVPPLATPAPGAPATLERARQSAGGRALRRPRPGGEARLRAHARRTPPRSSRLCRRLDGLPLAIELAAAKMRLLTPAGIAQRLEAQPAAADGGRPRPAGAPPHDAGDDRLERRPALAATTGSCCEDLGVFAERFTLEAVEAIGGGPLLGRARDRRARGAHRRLARQADRRRRRPVLSLLAIVREYALGRLKERGEADRMRAAHADYYTALVRRDAARAARRAARRRRSRRSAWSWRTCAPRCATSSTPTGSTTPPTSRGACSSTGGSWASSTRSGCGCSSCSARSGRSGRTPARSRGSSPCGRDVAATVARRSSRASPSACDLFARERRRGRRGHGARRARDRARAAARPRHRHRRARARGCGGPSAPTGQRLGRGDHARVARPGRLAARRPRRGARALRRGRARSPTRAATCSRGPSPATSSARLLLVEGEIDDAEARVPPNARGLGGAAPRRGRRLRARGTVRGRRRARRRAARRRAVGGRRGDPAAHRRVRRRGVHGAPASLDACARPTPRRWRRASSRARS